MATAIAEKQAASIGRSSLELSVISVTRMIDRAEGIVDGHKQKAIGHSNARGYSGIRVAKVEQAQPEQSSFFGDPVRADRPFITVCPGHII